MDFVKISIPSKNIYIKLLRNMMKDFCTIIKYKNEDEIFMIELALNEAIANIIEHTYKYEENKKIDLSIEYDDDVLTIKIRDYGEKIIPENIKHRDLDNIRDGGLGVYIIEQVFGKPQWVYCNDGNLMILKKILI
ncbi:ATP-binding protein [Oceanotoga sp. DSM 15011]|jgi:serine/threonine-protein kinase RsbW|uniref:Serine/threonine-protein kinase RsbW n=1 Tax=Oceanotoga teriensis TaxID=515440 RepID=A0AA45C8R1_9BACT|nr:MULTISPECIES: ATP-binding protein [Oceanotoga]MDN5342405.1 serine/threonine-protein kinase RsbW [Oceanotoga sp.]MDO7975514.1 ATP-binding protein [Oceanotoga teriensis]PWJ96198.1 serine/threonine-protein kinase RsbW [Oceanotoga teriensis]UYO99981.1 ATP-binding protein [Oceanotoga sp. DSM 15011]